MLLRLSTIDLYPTPARVAEEPRIIGRLNRQAQNAMKAQVAAFGGTKAGGINLCSEAEVFAFAVHTACDGYQDISYLVQDIVAYNQHAYGAFRLHDRAALLFDFRRNIAACQQAQTPRSPKWHLDARNHPNTMVYILGSRTKAFNVQCDYADSIIQPGDFEIVEFPNSVLHRSSPHFAANKGDWEIVRLWVQRQPK